MLTTISQDVRLYSGMFDKSPPSLSTSFGVAMEVFMSYINDDTMMRVWLTLFVLLILWFIIRYLYDTLFLEEEYAICELAEKYEGRDIHSYDSPYYDGFYSPLWFDFIFYVNGEKIIHSVNFDLFEKIKEDVPMFVTYGTTRLSKKIKVKKIEAIK